MNKKLRDKLNVIDTYPTQVRDALMLTRSEADVIDVIGSVKANERRYKDVIRGASSELDLVPNVVTKGEMHQVEVGNEASRSFNIPNLMRKLQDAGFTFMDLIEHDVLRVSWQWTKLRNFAQARGIELIIDHDREVSILGDEEADVGEVWTTSKYPRWT